MTNHPNRSRRNPTGWPSPSPGEVQAAREAAGLTQAQAAALVRSGLRAWQKWEAPADTSNARPMHPGLWELFQIKAREGATI